MKTIIIAILALILAGAFGFFLGFADDAITQKLKKKADDNEVGNVDPARADVRAGIRSGPGHDRRERPQNEMRGTHKWTN